MTSLPVDRIATRGRANTSTSAQPIAASAPMRLGVSTSPAAHDEIAGRDVRAAPADVLAGGRGARIVDCRSAARRRLFDHDHGVGALGQRRAGRDLGAGAGATVARWQSGPCRCDRRSAAAPARHGVAPAVSAATTA